MSIYVSIREMKKLLQSLSACLDKASAYAQARKFDPNVLLQARLAPDMFPFMRQVQAACDQAKYAASRVAGREPPPHADTEQTIDDLKKRIAAVTGYLDEFSEQDFVGAENRSVTTPRWDGKSMTALNYFVEHAQPNFFFHYTTAYALLRHNGVDVGKRDYLGALTWK
jgi:uncharacterized protein